MKAYTVEQVARLCKVTPQIVSKWFESGNLSGFREPGTQTRLIPRTGLIRFLKDHGMPLGYLEGLSDGTVMFVSQDYHLSKQLEEGIRDKGYGFLLREHVFDAGVFAERVQPECVIVDFAVGRSSGLQVCTRLKEIPEFIRVALIVLLPPKVSPDSITIVKVNEVWERPLVVSHAVERAASFVKASMTLC